MSETDDNGWGITEGVGVTAVLVAMWRMEENASQDPLFEDPYAQYLVQAALDTGWRPPFTGEVLDQLKTVDPSAVKRLQAAKDYASVRTKFFDEMLRNACADGVDQIVVLAAGLDARPWRLAWPEKATVYEVDQPKVLAFKAETLRTYDAAARYVPVGIDLRHDWPSALLRSGWNCAQRTAWLVEGLLVYLSAADQDVLFARIDALGRPGDWIGVEAPGETFHSTESRNSRDMDTASARAVANQLGTGIIDVPKLHVPSDHSYVATWLDQNNWEAVMVNSADLMARYGRLVSADAQDGLVDTMLIEGRRAG